MPTSNSKIKFPDRFGGGRRGVGMITGILTIGAAGAITAGATGELYTAVKNAAAGRYDITFDRTYRTQPRFIGATLVATDTAAFGNANGNTVNGRSSATNNGATLQAFLASSGADTNIASGYQIHFAFEVQEL